MVTESSTSPPPTCIVTIIARVLNMPLHVYLTFRDKLSLLRGSLMRKITPLFGWRRSHYPVGSGAQCPPGPFAHWRLGAPFPVNDESRYESRLFMDGSARASGRNSPRPLTASILGPAGRQGANCIPLRGQVGAGRALKNSHPSRLLRVATLRTRFLCLGAFQASRI